MKAVLIFGAPYLLIEERGPVSRSEYGYSDHAPSRRIAVVGPIHSCRHRQFAMLPAESHSLAGHSFLIPRQNTGLHQIVALRLFPDRCDARTLRSVLLDQETCLPHGTQLLWERAIHVFRRGGGVVPSVFDDVSSCSFRCGHRRTGSLLLHPTTAAEYRSPP
jgi:hypothetical protein